ncbi:hypothetical protein [Pricia sp.]|uniref:hypothetical protein n=1 Tax=Pricia sp. TaxID=2268138 RepID=UPI0035938B5A
MALSDKKRSFYELDGIQMAPPARTRMVVDWTNLKAPRAFGLAADKGYIPVDLPEKEVDLPAVTAIE